MTVWFTLQLENKPGSLARVANALAERGVNITGIMGIAEDSEGALMLTTSDAVATRAAFAFLDLAFEEHDPGAAWEADAVGAPGLGRRGPA